MALQLYNTLSGKVEEFKPREDNLVRMYACGLTVYDYGHIGNFRTFIAVDVLRRFLRQSGYGIKHVMNITDVDDKIIRNAMQKGVPIAEYTKKFAKAFLDDMQTLSLEAPEMHCAGNRAHSGDGAFYCRVWSPRATPIAPMKARTTSASPAFPSTASSARRTSPA